ncbi:hypothetical protein M407DRAFT_17618 [Tulasnella calospora MUT 4182]|uniref:Uncharacterized protein n=1 Tax=Tulasnella calospora MUT 4182 TaxID=1051891 RepID=A0A0C3QXA3_9AGAM|nr:hypothetical protein M407DRAFT_17618 [Tulasnella calospora MUT 4182]
MKTVNRASNETDENAGGNVSGSRSGKWATTPPEPLSLIFEAGLECIFPKSEFTRSTVDDGELCQFTSTITQTCRWWRQVALETPRLWSTLILSDTTPLEKLETWLARSKAAPLHINLQKPFTPGTPSAFH